MHGRGHAWDMGADMMMKNTKPNFFEASEIQPSFNE